MNERFIEHAKLARSEELVEKLRPFYEAHWKQQEFVEFMRLMGIVEPSYFIATGWWVPHEVRQDPEEREVFVDRLETAIGRGDLPDPAEHEYAWDDFMQLVSYYELELRDIVKNLIAEYALTFGESLLLDSLKEVKGNLADADSAF